jgi:hypothetical protein
MYACLLQGFIECTIQRTGIAPDDKNAAERPIDLRFYQHLADVCHVRTLLRAHEFVDVDRDTRIGGIIETPLCQILDKLIVEILTHRCGELAEHDSAVAKLPKFTVAIEVVGSEVKDLTLAVSRADVHKDALAPGIFLILKALTLTEVNAPPRHVGRRVARIAVAVLSNDTEVITLYVDDGSIVLPEIPLESTPTNGSIEAILRNLQNSSSHGHSTSPFVPPLDIDVEARAHLEVERKLIVIVVVKLCNRLSEFVEFVQ